MAARPEHAGTKKQLGGLLPKNPSRKKIPRFADLPPLERPMLEIPPGRFPKSDAANYVELKETLE